MRVAFAGTPQFAATVLRGLLDSDHEVGLVISQPDSRRGRGRKTSPTPVAELATAEGLTLRQPGRIGELDGEISDYDALVVAAYGQILRAGTLYAARHGAYNVHASLLPAYRGAAPIERAIMAGEKKTGVSITRMDEGLDTGPVILRREVPIPSDMNAGELADALALVGSEALVEALSQVESGVAELREQDDAEATYAAKISAEDRIIRWDRTAEEIRDQVRALSPHIGARAAHPDFDGPVKVLRASVVEGDGPPLGIGEIDSGHGRILVGCGTGLLEIEELQVPGRRPLRAEEFLKGNSFGGTFTR
ncbi:MAG: methionyl-tRNA formyltransferase [Actinomycetota bacterium]|nr:methionyl-tRNA formyltransferase [Actinomycetota bacterium]